MSFFFSIELILFCIKTPTYTTNNIKNIQIIHEPAAVNLQFCRLLASQAEIVTYLFLFLIHN